MKWHATVAVSLMASAFAQEEVTGDAIPETGLALEETTATDGLEWQVLDPNEGYEFANDMIGMSTNATRGLFLTVVNASTGSTHRVNYTMQKKGDEDLSAVDDDDFSGVGRERRLAQTGFSVAITTELGVDFPFSHYSCMAARGTCIFHNDTSSVRRLGWGVFAAVAFAIVVVGKVAAIAIAASENVIMANEHSGTRRRRSCIAADAVFQTDDGNLPVVDIREGHHLTGVDFNGNEAQCKVVMKVFEGYATVYGNYTADHLMLAPDGSTVPHGLHSDPRSEVPIYTVMTSNCVAITDVDGLQPTAFTSRTCGVGMNFTDLVSASQSAVELHSMFGDIIFTPRSWTGELHSEHMVPLCIRMIRCAKNMTGCDDLEESVSQFVDTNAPNSLVALWERQLTSHVIRNRIAGLSDSTHSDFSDSSDLTDTVSSAQRSSLSVLAILGLFVFRSNCSFGFPRQLGRKARKAGLNSAGGM